MPFNAFKLKADGLRPAALKILSGQLKAKLTTSSAKIKPLVEERIVYLSHLIELNKLNQDPQTSIEALTELIRLRKKIKEAGELAAGEDLRREVAVAALRKKLLSRERRVKSKPVAQKPTPPSVKISKPSQALNKKHTLYTLELGFFTMLGCTCACGIVSLFMKERLLPAAITGIVVGTLTMILGFFMIPRQKTDAPVGGSAPV